MDEAIGPAKAGSKRAGSMLAGIASRLPRRVWILAAFLILVGAGLLYALVGFQTPVSYTTVPITRGTVARMVTSTGSVNPILTITVGSYVSGVIQEINCDFNTVVKKGQLCARIDPRPYQMAVEQDQAAEATAKAQLLKDQANLAYAEANEKRQRNLLAEQATSQDSYDVASNALNQARAQVAIDQATIQQRNAELDAAKVNLGYTDIVSPVDGIVVSRNVTVGQTVAASFQTPTLFLIATDLSKMQVDTNVSESDIGGIRVGDKAQFTVEAYPDRVFDGTVTQVRQAPQTVQNVVTYDVLVTVANPGQTLKPGMTATMRIITQSRKNVLRVSNQALRFMPGGVSANSEMGGPPSRLWLLEDGKPQAVTVRTGLDDDNFTEITGGDVQAGERVIVSENVRSSGGSARPALRLP
jgi:HlyD family secretion protein